MKRQHGQTTEEFWTAFLLGWLVALLIVGCFAAAAKQGGA